MWQETVVAILPVGAVRPDNIFLQSLRIELQPVPADAMQRESREESRDAIHRGTFAERVSFG